MSRARHVRDGTCSLGTGKAHTYALEVCVRWQYSLTYDRQAWRPVAYDRPARQRGTSCGPLATTTARCPTILRTQRSQACSPVHHSAGDQEAMQVIRDTGIRAHTPSARDDAHAPRPQAAVWCVPPPGVVLASAHTHRQAHEAWTARPRRLPIRTAATRCGWGRGVGIPSQGT
jgi:hypothetical protein